MFELGVRNETTASKGLDVLIRTLARLGEPSLFVSRQCEECEYEKQSTIYFLMSSCLYKHISTKRCCR